MCEYLTFPIIILKNGFADIKVSVDNAMHYCLYDYCSGIEGNQADRIAKAEEYLGITFGNSKKAFENGRGIFTTIPPKSPKTSIRKKMIFDFYKESKTEFEIVTFLAFASIRSILQKQPYTKITNEYFVGRMACNNKGNEELPEWIFKYNNRYQLDKIKQELQLNWGLKLYARHTRGFYVSFSIELVQLITHAENRRLKFKLKELQREKEQARLQALKHLNGNST